MRFCLSLRREILQTSCLGKGEELGFFVCGLVERGEREEVFEGFGGAFKGWWGLGGRQRGVVSGEPGVDVVPVFGTTFLGAGEGGGEDC